MSALIRFFIVLCISFSYSLAQADCIDLSQASNWSDINTHKIIMYEDGKAIAVLVIPHCNIYNTSEIKLTNSTICDQDKIIVSEQFCIVQSIRKP
jgi:hypothetical protein